MYVDWLPWLKPPVSQTFLCVDNPIKRACVCVYERSCFVMYDVQCWFFSWSPHPYPQPPPFDHGRKENTVQLVPRFYTTLCLFTISIVSLDLTFLFIRFVYSSWERLFRPTPPLAWTLVYFCKWKLQLFLLFFLVFRTYQRNRVFLQSSMHVAFTFLSLFWFSSPMIFLLFLFSFLCLFWFDSLSVSCGENWNELAATSSERITRSSHI